MISFNSDSTVSDCLNGAESTNVSFFSASPFPPNAKPENKRMCNPQ